MKNLELQNYGVATMSAREMRSTNGGYIIAFAIAGLVLAFALGVYNGYKAAEAADCQ